MFIYTLVILLSFLFPLVGIIFLREKRTLHRVIELILVYQLVFNVGVLGIISFLGHTLFPLTAAKHLSWPSGPFQQELANASLGFGVIGVLCYWIRNHFWTATVIGSSIWLFADAVDHLYDIFFNENVSTVNEGIVFYSDLLIPFFLCFLLILSLRLKVISYDS
jgi:hypothetical protein